MTHCRWTLSSSAPAGRYAPRTLAGNGRTAYVTNVPSVFALTVFTDTQLGRVGLTEREALVQERSIRVASLPMNRVARAREVGETRGFMKAIVDATSGQILGCAILGIEGGEVMAVLQVAMMGHVPYTTIEEGVFAHPTLAESLNNLFMTLDD